MAHKVHAGYTVLAPILPGHAGAVSALLRTFRADPRRLPFVDVPSLHFATGTVLPATSWGTEPLPATLMVATSFCGPDDVHVDELVRVAGSGLRELFAHCQGFAPDASDVDLAEFLARHRQWETFYSGMHDLTRADVLAHDKLRTEIEDFIDRAQRDDELPSTPTAIHAAIRAFVGSRADLRWALVPDRRPASAFWARHRRTIRLATLLVPYLAGLVVGTAMLPFGTWPALEVAVGLGWLGLFAFVAVLVVALAGVFEAERRQTFVAGRPPDEYARALAASQCNPVINEMTASAPLKEGDTRPFVLTLALWIIARAAEGLPIYGSLNIPTVATARWVPVDRSRRLVFISNFTNAAEPYVRDFVDNSAQAVNINLTFGWGYGYPKTRGIILDGAIADPNGFINVVNTNQQVTELWFCPYAHLSVDNINRSREIRNGIAVATPGEKEASQWLTLL